MAAKETCVIQIGARRIQPQKESIAPASEVRLVGVAGWKITGVGGAAHVRMAGGVDRDRPALADARAAEVSGIDECRCRRG